MATSLIKTNLSNTKHHYVRTLLSSFFGSIALALIIVSIVVVWLDHTLTDTDQYVKTVAPLVKDPDVQNFVVDKVSGAILENKDAPVKDVASRLLGEAQVVGKTDEQLRMEITPVVKESLASVVTSSQFVSLWEMNNRDVHGQLIAQLNSDSQTINLNFQPVISGVVNQLSTTKLSFVKGQFKLPTDAGTVTVQGKQLDTVRNVYNYFKTAMIAILVSAVLAAVLAVVISVHHLKTVRRIALATAIFSGILAAVLSASSLIKVKGMDVEQQRMATALVNGLTYQLRLSLIILAIVCILVTVGTKVYTVIKNRPPSGAKR